MSDSITYNSEKYSSGDIIRLNGEGIKVLCPICHSELLVITSKELVTKYQKPQGIFCPKNNNHVWIKFILTEERNQFWERVGKLMENSTEDKP
jgi:hypothetical protein